MRIHREVGGNPMGSSGQGGRAARLAPAAAPAMAPATALVVLAHRAWVLSAVVCTPSQRDVEPRGGRRRGGGHARARSHCRFTPPPIHFIPDSLTYSVPLFLNRQCDRTLGHGPARRARRAGGAAGDALPGLRHGAGPATPGASAVLRHTKPSWVRWGTGCAPTNPTRQPTDPRLAVR